MNYEKAEIFYKQGYNIYNLSSEFYTDKCKSANINGNDIVIKDRIEEIYPYNVSFCSIGCELNNVEIESKRVKCSCNISYNEEIIDINNNNRTKLNASENFFIYLLDSLNYKIFGCFKIIFESDIKDLIINVGFFFGIGFILFNIICYSIFSCYYLPKIRIQIYKLIPNNNSIFKKENSFLDNKKKRIKRKKNTRKSKTIKASNILNFYLGNPNRKKSTTRKQSRRTTVKRSSEIRNIERENTINRNIVKIGTVKRQKRKRYTTKRKSNLKLSKEGSDIKENKLSDESLFNNENDIIIDNLNKIEEKDYNALPYSQALKLDKRNIFSIYISLIKMKIDIIPILFYPEEFTHISLTLSIYTFEFFFSFFLNALLFTDDVVSEKYHNNGQLDFFTTIFLSLTSNIISSIIMYFIEYLVAYREYLSKLVKDLKEKYEYILTFKKLYFVLKIKIFLFFIISFILSLIFSLYLIIFCQIYKKSQVSLIINFIIGLVESLAYSVGVSLIITFLRYLGLKLKTITLYRTSVYLFEKL